MNTNDRMSMLSYACMGAAVPLVIVLLIGYDIVCCTAGLDRKLFILNQSL